MTSFDPASNQHPLLVQPIIPNPVPWLATPEPAGLALVSEPMALTPLAWATPSDLPTPTPFNGQIAALGAPADPVTGLAATQATATSSPIDTFSNGSSGWTTASGAAAPIATNAAYGSFMGPFANGSKAAGQDVWKTFDLKSLGGKISFDFYRFDTWDQETFKVYANDVNILSSTFGWENNVTQVRTGSANGYSWTITPVNDYTVRPEWNALTRQSFHVTITAPNGVGTLKLGFGSTLDEAADNESYGIGSVSVGFANPIYDNDFENNANGFTTQWRDGGLGAQGAYVGRFGYNSGTSLTVGNGSSYALNQDKATTISYDYLRIDDWRGQIMHFRVDLGYGWGDWGPPYFKHGGQSLTTSVDLSKQFDTGRREGDFTLEGRFRYQIAWDAEPDHREYREGTVKMHFQSYMYGNFGQGGSRDEAFHVTMTISSADTVLPGGFIGAGVRPPSQQKIGSKIGLSWYADNPKNAGTRSWGIDNMLITQAADPVTTVASVASVSTQPMPNAFVASNPTPIVGSSLVVSPLATPVLAPTGDPASFMGLTPDSALAPTSDAKAAARLKPISYWAGLKNSHVAKRLLGLQAAR